MAQALTFTQDRLFAIESPTDLVEGVSVTLTCAYWAAPSSVSAVVYRNRALVTSTVMPAGATSVSGNVATLKPLTALVGGAKYIIDVTATVNGDTTVKKIEVNCVKAAQEQ